MSFIDEELTQSYIDLIKTLNITKSIEVGAFDADYSCLVAKEKICNDIWAFEASPYVYDKFSPILPKEINYKFLAISDYTGSIPFEIQEDNNPSEVGNNSIKNRNENKSYSYVNVPCSKLDDMFSNTKDRISLWIDAEGANREVLTGAEKLLDNVVSIFIETEDKQFWNDSWESKDVEDYLSSKGFKLLSKKEQYVMQHNCIFRR